MKVVLVDSIAKEAAREIRAYLEKTKLPFPAYRTSRIRRRASSRIAAMPARQGAMA